MAATVLELGLSNLVVAAVLAALALAAGTWGKRPALTHALWLLVLLKLVTPPVVNLPVRLLPASEPPAVAKLEPPPPLPQILTGPLPDDAPFVGQVMTEPAQPQQSADLPPAPRKLELKPKPEPTLPPPPTFTPPKGRPPAPPADVPVFVLDKPTGPTTGAAAAPGPQAAFATAAPQAEAATAPAPARPFPWAEIVLAGWLGGSAVWVGLVALRVRRFARVLRLADDAPPWFAREVDAVARSLGLAVPRVKLIPGAVAPMVWSLGRTAVYFPAELLARLSAEQRASLIAHELAHLKRGDHRVRWLEVVALSLYWWCPLAWLARRELQRAEEECCDAWVVATLPEGNHAYATALLDTLDFLAEADAAPVLASGMGAVGAVKRRLLLILDGRTPKALPRAGRVAVVLAALVLLPVAPKLARLAAATPGDPAAREATAPGQAGNAEAKQTASAVAPAQPAPPPANPRGETLMFDTASTLIRPRGVTMWAVAVSPDGKTIATGHGEYSTKGEVRIWDRESGKVTHTIPYEKGVRAVAFSPDGTTLATTCFDGALRLHDPATFALWAVGDEASGGHTKAGINHLCFFKRGRYLATAGFDNTIRVWDVAAVAAKRRAGDPLPFPPVAVFEGHAQRVLSVAASEDGRTLLSGSTDRTARVWDVPDPLPALGDKPLVVRKERLSLPGHTSGVEAIAVSPDGQLLVTGAWGGTLLVRDRDGKSTVINSQFMGGVFCAAFSPDGKYLAVGAGGRDAPRPKEVRVWDVAERKEVAYRGDLADATYSLAFSPDGKTLFLAGSEQTVHVWRWAEKEHRLLTAPGVTFAPQPILAAAVSPDNSLLVFAGESKSVFVFHRKDGGLLAELTAHADVVSGLAFSPDGRTLATASYDKTIKLWDTKTWAERKTLRGHTGWALSAAFSPDGRTLATGSYDKTVRLWDAETGEPMGVWKDHSAGVRSIAFSPDGRWLASAGADRIIRLWDTTDGSIAQLLKGHKGAVRSVAFAPDGRTLASGSEDRTVKLWDPKTGKERATIAGMPDMVGAVRFSPKGQTLAAGTFQGPTVICDPLTAHRRQTLGGHNEPVTAVLFADDGTRLITASQDRGMREWPAAKPADATALRTFRGLALPAAAVAVSPDGRRAVSGGTDGSLTFWDATTGEIDGTIPDAHPDGVTHVAWSGDGQRVVSAGRDGKVQVWSAAMRDRTWSIPGRFACFSPDGKQLAVVNGRAATLHEAATGSVLRTFVGGHDGPVLCAAFSPDGRLLATAGEDTRAVIWDAAAGGIPKKVSQPLGNFATIRQLAFSPDGDRLAVASNSADAQPPDDMTGQFRIVKGVYVFALSGDDPARWMNELPQPLQHPGDIQLTAVAWTAGGGGLITTATDGMVRVWNPDDRRAVQSFRAHDAGVLAADAAPGSRAFLTSGEDLAIKRWALPAGLAVPSGLSRLTPPGQGRVWVADYDPRGRYFISAGAGDVSFRVYDRVPAAVPAQFGGSFRGATSAAYSPDNQWLVTGHTGGELIRWDAATGKRVGQLAGLAQNVLGVAFTKDGNTMVSVGGDVSQRGMPGEAVVWDAKTWKSRRNLTGHAGPLWAVAISPDGSRVAAACTDGTVRVWDLATGEPVRTLERHDMGARTVAFSPDGRRLVSGGFDNALRVWDTGNWQQLRAIPLPNSRPTAVAVSPDGKEVVAATRPNVGRPGDMTNCVIYVYKLDDPDAAPREIKGHAGAVLSLAFLKEDGKTLVSGGGRDGEWGEVKVWDYATGRQLAEFRGHRMWVEALAVSRDGTRVVSGAWANGRSGELRMWDVAGLRPVATVPMPGEKSYIAAGAISPDGKRLVLGGWEGKGLAVWDMTDPAEPQLVDRLPAHRGGLRSVHFNTDGSRFVTSDEAGFVRVWDAATLRMRREFRASGQSVYRAKFTPDGRSIVTCSGNWQQRTRGEIRVWDAESGKETARFPDQNREVWDVAFLDGGKVMVTSQAVEGKPDDAHLKVWDFATKQVLRTPLPANAFTQARCLAASPDGKFVALGSGAGPLKVFDATSWQEVMSVADLQNVCFRVAFAPDGGSVAVASGDNAAVVIRVPTK
jgi:WD40 repeat protein/beta-lactamase regulating signal transducer with metallopeptidase domain